jgi:hypothetical protein
VFLDAKTGAGQDRAVPIVDRLARLLADHRALMNPPESGLRFPEAGIRSRPASSGGLRNRAALTWKEAGLERLGFHEGHRASYASGTARRDALGVHTCAKELRNRPAGHARAKDLSVVPRRIRTVKGPPVLALVLAALLAVGCDAEQTQDGAPARTEVPAREVLSRSPYLGVSCRTPNSFACDRVGLAVWLREPAVKVDAEIAGQRLQLDDPEWSGAAKEGQRAEFAGFLQPAGLIDGPLRVTADDGPDRWIGRKPVSASVDLRIARQDGTTTTTTVEVGLSPGWG